MKPILSIRVKICMVILVVLMVGGAVSASAQDRRKIVIFTEGTLLSAQELIITLSGSTITDTLSLINALAIELPLEGTQDALAFLLSQPDVVGVFDDLVGFASAVTAVPAEQVPSEEIYDWGEERIGAHSVHQNHPELRGTGVSVAILDTGIDNNHLDLKTNIGDGYNTFQQKELPKDGNGHGTHMAGIIAAAANGQGIVGVAPEARIRAIKVLDDAGAGRLSKLIKGMGWVFDHHIRLVNMSLQFPEESVPLERATRRLYEAGMIMVAAAGNCVGSSSTLVDGGGSSEGGGDAEEGTTSACTDSQLNVQYPAHYSWVIAVAATDYKDGIPDYSVSGPEIDVAAPGGSKADEQIFSTTRGGGYGLLSGTSPAAAHVTGSIALALQHKPGLSFGQVLDLLRSTAWNLNYPETQQGAGLINAPKLVDTLQ